MAGTFVGSGLVLLIFAAFCNFLTVVSVVDGGIEGRNVSRSKCLCGRWSISEMFTEFSDNIR
ncbi:hypothetical protein N656DRAFT_783426 [Canariomyces notabilis]|uniref:Uncharacterized protein n=1 Tax=Canariomyces notabilis TaxID=2074819 RepID=A0AAN6QLF4_9PEZI|nr:hypothetical protein N656DRAFT_783426 [Canariomyces arenarius]